MAAAPILFMDHATALGGAEKILLLLLEGLDRARFVPHLVASPGELAAAARRAGVTVHEVPLRRLRGEPTAPWRLGRTLVPLLRVLRHERIAVVCPHSARASVYATAVAKVGRRPLLWHLHEPGPSAFYRRLMCGLCDAAIAVSAAVADAVPCRQKVRIIYNGIRWTDFTAPSHVAARQLRQSWGVPPDAILIGQVARLQPWKGQRDVIAAANVLLHDHPNVYVAIIGGDIFGDAATYQRELKVSLGDGATAGRVILTGHQEDVPAVLGALDMLVHASSDEPFGTILLEAGAAGLPIVAYASGGVAEVLTHEETALLVPSGDRAGLAAALSRLVTHATLARALGDALRERIRTRFDATRMVAEVQEVLAALVRGRRNQGAEGNRTLGPRGTGDATG